jgi:hypothetical protein
MLRLIQAAGLSCTYRYLLDAQSGCWMAGPDLWTLSADQVSLLRLSADLISLWTLSADLIATPLPMGGIATRSHGRIAR